MFSLGEWIEYDITIWVNGKNGNNAILHRSLFWNKRKWNEMRTKTELAMPTDASIRQCHQHYTNSPFYCNKSNHKPHRNWKNFCEKIEFQSRQFGRVFFISSRLMKIIMTLHYFIFYRQHVIPKRVNLIQPSLFLAPDNQRKAEENEFSKSIHYFLVLRRTRFWRWAH